MLRERMPIRVSGSAPPLPSSSSSARPKVTMRVADTLRLVLVVVAWAAATPALSAQRAVLDSVRITGVRPNAVVILRAPNVSFAVRSHSEASIVAVLRDAKATPARVSLAGVLRATSEHDTTRVELARPLNAPGHFDVVLPIGVTLRLEGDNGGPVHVEGVRGPVEISHSNGSITVLDASGSAVVATSNGSIDVRLTSVTPDVPMSFITSNGNVDLTLPPDVRATVVVDRSVDLESAFAVSRNSAENDPRSSLIRLNVNGGGPTIRVYTNNGIVRLHSLTSAR
jgi:hypothetical protein